MLPLGLIWWITEILAFSSLGTMLVLVTRRYLAEREAAAEDARLRELRPVLFHCLDGHEPLADILARLDRADHAGLVVLARRLINALTGESREVLVRLMYTLGQVEVLLGELRRKSVPARLQAASDLCWFDTPDVRAALAHALHDRFYGVRVTAANSLLVLGSRNHAAEIVSSLTDGVDPLPLSLRPLFRQLAAMDALMMVRLADSPNEPVAVLAIDALAAARDGVDYGQLCRIATEHAGKNARAAALRTLGLLGADPAERQAALPNLASREDPAGTPFSDTTRVQVARAVRRTLSDRDWEVRTQAVIATQRLALTDAIPRLLAMQSDPQWWVRFRCTQALRALQGSNESLVSRSELAPGGLSSNRVEPTL